MSEMVSALRIQLLGEFRVWNGARLIGESEWRLRKAKSLVKLLALAPGHRLHREQVMDALWPDLDPAAAANNLHKTLHVARRALEPDLQPSRPSQFLHLQGDLVSLRPPGSLEIDAEAFEAGLDAARRTGDPTAYEAALELYAGDLLPEDRYEEWTADRRDELATELERALMELAPLQERSGDLDGAMNTLRRVIARDPTHEQAHRSLMRLHAVTGQRHQALRQYQQLRHVLQRELETEPEPETDRLYQEILSGSFGSAAAPAQPVPAATQPLTASRTPAVVDTPLVGRDEEVERLEDLLDALFAGHGHLVLLAGEAGVGKTRLQLEIADRVSRRGGFALLGAGYEQEGQLPYGPFVEAIGHVAQDLPTSELSRLLAEASAELARLVPSIAAKVSEPPAGGSLDRQRLFAAVAGFLSRLSERAPVLLALDDLHASDEASLQLVHYLARTLRERPILLVAAYRSEEAATSSPLGQLLAALDREGLGDRLQLGRVDGQESDLLVDALLGREPVEHAVHQVIFGLAAGNPLYTVEAIRSLREAGQLQLVNGRWSLGAAPLSTPARLAALITARVDRLGAPERTMLNLASVIGREASYPLLRAASELPEPQLLDALDVCLELHLIEETPAGYRFSHPLHRAALYERLSAARRTFLHGRVAGALESIHAGQLDAHAEALAHHYLRSEQPGRAVPHLITASDRAAAVHANEAAIEGYRRALELLGTPGAPPRTAAQVADLWERIGDCYGVMGQPGSDIESYETALAAVVADIGLTAARLHRKAAYAYVAQHQPQAAELHLEQALAALSGQADEAERGRVLRVRAHLLWEQGAYAEGVQAAEQALALAEQHGDVADTIAAYSTLALVFHSHGDWQRGLQFVIEHLGIQADDPQLAQLFDAHL